MGAHVGRTYRAALRGRYVRSGQHGDRARCGAFGRVGGRKLVLGSRRRENLTGLVQRSR